MLVVSSAFLLHLALEVISSTSNTLFAYLIFFKEKKGFFFSVMRKCKSRIEPKLPEKNTSEVS